MATVVLLLASLSVLLPQCSIIVMTEVVIVYIRLPLLTPQPSSVSQTIVKGEKLCNESLANWKKSNCNS